jgi:hypothetical protein
MKTKLMRQGLLALLLLCYAHLLPAQNMYAIGASPFTNKLLLLRFNPAVPSTTSIRVYDTADLPSVNPRLSSFDPVNGAKLLVAPDSLGVQRLIGIDVNNGNFVYSYPVTLVAPEHIEYAAGKVYLFGTAISGGFSQLAAIDLSNGLETIVSSYPAGFFPSASNTYTSYNHLQNRLLYALNDSSNAGYVLSINPTNGMVDTAFTTNAYRFGPFQYGNGYAYSLAYHYSSGQHQLRRIDLLQGQDTLLATYDSSIIGEPVTDYSCFDFAQNKLIVEVMDMFGNFDILPLDATNGQGTNFISHGPYGFYTLECGNGPSVGVDPALAVPLVVYPQPATSHVRVQGAAPDAELTLLDLAGRTVRHSLQNPAGLQVEGLPTGCYLLQVKDAAGLRSLRIVKE